MRQPGPAADNASDHAILPCPRSALREHAGCNEDRNVKLRFGEYGPSSARSLHRGCEDGGVDSTGFIDNNNDGEADPDGAKQYWAVDHDRNKIQGTGDPKGEFEEDLYARVPMEEAKGVSDFSAEYFDMVCTVPMLLELVSRAGPMLDGSGNETRSVEQEYIINMASAWTDAATGVRTDNHKQDSSQWRFVLRDTEWGAPHPASCSDWNSQDPHWTFAASRCSESQRGWHAGRARSQVPISLTGHAGHPSAFVSTTCKNERPASPRPARSRGTA